MAQKKAEADRKCWENGSIFQSIKVILEISLTPPSGPPVIDVSFTQPSFTSTFGYPDEDFPMSLERLISGSNTEQDVSILLQAILTGSSYNAFITLQDFKGIHLACNVQVSVGNKVDNRVSPSSSEPAGRRVGILRNHITTLTIRSASTLGNAKALHVLVDPSLMNSTEHVHTMQKVNERIEQNVEIGTAKSGEKSAVTTQKQPASLKFQSKNTSSTTNTTNNTSSTKNRSPAAPPPCTSLSTVSTDSTDSTNNITTTHYIHNNQHNNHNTHNTHITHHNYNHRYNNLSDLAYPHAESYIDLPVTKLSGDGDGTIPLSVYHAVMSIGSGSESSENLYSSNGEGSGMVPVRKPSLYTSDGNTSTSFDATTTTTSTSSASTNADINNAADTNDTAGSMHE